MEKRPKTLTLVFGIIAVIGLGFAYHYYSLAKNPGKAAENEARSVVEDISEHILLPEGELPTVAVVSDLTALQAQPFFARAEVGDRVIIYTNAKKAYLYRPSLDKLIEVSSLNTDVSSN